MFLAMYCGAELIIIPTDFTAKTFLLEKAIQTIKELSFAQFTPAVLQRFSNNFLKSLFGPVSLIKNILIGGDIFPLNLVCFYCSENCSANIYNVYGVTEVSCWATCYKIDLKFRFFICFDAFKCFFYLIVKILTMKLTINNNLKLIKFKTIILAKMNKIFYII